MKQELELKKNPYSEYIQAHIRAEQKAKELNKQRELDFQKWIESEYRNTDLSGLMPYCMMCSYCKEHKCLAEDDNRVNNALCFKAYDKLDKVLNK